MNENERLGNIAPAPTKIYELGAEPINRTAGKVIRKATPLDRFCDLSEAGQSQQQFQERIKNVISKQGLKTIPAFAKDWTATKFGRIEVVAYSHSRTRMKKGVVHYWVVRCTCGEYEMRTHTTLGRMCQKSGHGSDIACENCKRFEYIKQHAQYLESQQTKKP